MSQKKGKVIIELPRTPANAWLFEPIENHPEVPVKEKKAAEQANTSNESASHLKED